MSVERMTYEVCGVVGCCDSGWLPDEGGVGLATADEICHI